MANKKRLTVADVRKAILDSKSEDLLDGDYNKSDLETEEEKSSADEATRVEDSRGSSEGRLCRLLVHSTVLSQ